MGVVIAVLAAGGIIGFQIDSSNRQTDYVVGSDDASRVELDVTLQRVDVTGRELDLRIIPVHRMGYRYRLHVRTLPGSSRHGLPAPQENHPSIWVLLAVRKNLRRSISASPANTNAESGSN